MWIISLGDLGDLTLTINWFNKSHLISQFDGFELDLNSIF